MSDILIRRGHGLPLKRAKLAAENIANRLREEFDLGYEWEGDTLHFRRSGVSGQLLVTRQEIEIRVRLGFLLLPLRGRIEQEIHAYFDEQFGHGGTRI